MTSRSPLVVTNKRPLRKVVCSTLSSLAGSRPGEGTRIETLECGHTTPMKISRPLAKRRKCLDCRMVKVGEHVVDLRYHTQDELASDGEPPMLSAQLYCDGRVHMVLDYLDPYDEDVSKHESLAAARESHEIQFVYELTLCARGCKCEEPT